MDVIDWFVRYDTADASGFVDRYGTDGIVWYLETYDMAEDRIRTLLRLMREKGWLRECTGFVFGRPLFYHGESPYNDAVMAEIGDMGVPAVFDADVGHKAPRMTFVNGAMAEFDVRNGACELSYRFV